MISTLTLVSLGLLQTGGIEIVTVIDPAKADIADIDAAVRDYAEAVIGPAELGYAIPADAVTENAVDASDGSGAASSSTSYRSDKPHPPVPPAESTTGEIATNNDTDIVPCPILREEFREMRQVIKIDELAPDAAFIVLRQDERPSWVEQPPQLKGDGEHFVAVASDPWKTDTEASEALEMKLRTAVNDYINDQIGRPDAARRIHLPQEVIIDQVVSERYAEDLQFSDSAIGAMKQVHAKLVFTPQFRAAVAERWKEHVVNARLLRTGVLSTGVLVLLMMAFGVLKRLGRR